MKPVLNKKIILVFLFAAAILAGGVVFSTLFPNDTKFDSWKEDEPDGNNWAQEFIKLPSAWQLETGNKNLGIAVVDWGFDVEHEDLKENINELVFGYLKKSHGTHVSGIIGAKGNNDKGIAGVMWDAKMNLYGTGIKDSDEMDALVVVLAMKHALLNGNKIINFSGGSLFGNSEDASKEKKSWEKLIMDWVKERGFDALFVFSAGNDKTNYKNFVPSNLALDYSNVLAVSAIDKNGNLASFLSGRGSNYGTSTIAAPGAKIFSTVPLLSLEDSLPCYEIVPRIDGYGCMSGTSMAAPFVSGLAGLIWSRAEELGKTLTAAEVKNLIVEGAKKGGKFATDPDGNKIYIINVLESLKLLEPQYCGDGSINNGTEQCDGAELGGATCASVMGGTYTGILACSSVCAFDTSDCRESLPVSAAWPTFGYDNTRAGQSEYNGPATNSIKWTYTASSTWWSPYFGIVPIIGKNNIIYIGNDTERKLYALEPATGGKSAVVKWIFSDNGNPLGDRLSAPSLAGDGTIYIGSSSGKLFAVNSDGSLKWKYIADNQHWVGTSAVGNDGTIYFRTTYPRVDDKKDYLFAINPDGSLKWRYEMGMYSGISFVSIGPDGTIYSSTIYTDTFNESVYALNPDGTLKWRKYYRPGTSPVVGPDGTVYIINVYVGLEAVNPETGELKWFQHIYPSLKPSVAKDGTIIVDDVVTGALYALNPDGSEKWVKNGIGKAYTSSAAIGADGTVYIATNLPRLYALDINDGSVKWQLDGISGSSPAIGSEGTLYVGTNLNIYAIGE